MKISVIVPIGNYHKDIAQRAIDSAQAQTIPVSVYPIVDTHSNGASWARNQGAIEAGGDFLIFLDADDWVEPDFVEECLLAYRQGWYVYTDLFMGDKVHETPDKDAWLAGTTNTFHSPCCLLPYAAWKDVGGFDESLPALEDGAFFWALRANGYCGVRVPKPLIHYTSFGQRSKSLSETELNKLQRKLYRQWEGKFMGCCGQPGESPSVIKNDRSEGDVLLEYIGEPGWTNMSYPYGGGQLFIPRMFEGTQFWGNPAIVNALQVAGRPMFRVLADPKGSTPSVDAVLALAKAARNSGD